jgi:hypothetical protein
VTQKRTIQNNCINKTLIGFLAKTDLVSESFEAGIQDLQTTNTHDNPCLASRINANAAHHISI